MQTMIYHYVVVKKNRYALLLVKKEEIKFVLIMYLARDKAEGYLDLPNMKNGLLKLRCRFPSIKLQNDNGIQLMNTSLNNSYSLNFQYNCPSSNRSR